MLLVLELVFKSDFTNEMDICNSCRTGRSQAASCLMAPKIAIHGDFSLSVNHSVSEIADFTPETCNHKIGCLFQRLSVLPSKERQAKRHCLWAAADLSIFCDLPTFRENLFLFLGLCCIIVYVDISDNKS